jgi:ATP:ADP antiporter, AAA family
VYRLGDQVGAWGVAGLRWLGAEAAGLAWAAIPIALVWLINALWLGRRQEARARQAGAP